MWQASPYRSSIKSYCAYEKLRTAGVLIVERESATQLCTERFQPIDKNHVDIVKPLDREEPSYLLLRTAYRDFVSAPGLAIRDDASLPVTTYAATRLPFSSLPSNLRAPLPSGLSRRELERFLASRGVLELDGTTVVIEDTSSPVALSVHTLRLKNGARLVTNGADVTVAALKLAAVQGAVVSFDEGSAVAPPAAPRTARSAWALRGHCRAAPDRYD